MPDRTICFVSYHSGPGDASVSPDGYRVPGLFLHGGIDTLVKDADLPTPIKGRKAGAPWTLAVQPDTEHHHLGSQDLSLLYVRTMFRSRLPADIPKDRPPTLKPIRPADGCTGELWYDVRPDRTVRVTTAAAPLTGEPTGPGPAWWLPDETFAKAWVEFNRTGQTPAGPQTVSVESTGDAEHPTFTLTRSGHNTTGLRVRFRLSGDAVNGTDYEKLPEEKEIGWQAPQETVSIKPRGPGSAGKTATLTLLPG